MPFYKTNSIISRLVQDNNLVSYYQTKYPEYENNNLASAQSHPVDPKL